MGLKIAGYYQQDTPGSDPQDDQLVLVLSHDELVCMKALPGQRVHAFELFRLPQGETGWEQYFQQLLSESQLLNTANRHTHCWFNLPEALLVPADRCTGVAAEDYLNLVYGEAEKQDIRQEDTGRGITIAYRIPRSLHEMIQHHSVLYQPHHIYSSLVKELPEQNEHAEHHLKVQVFHSHIIAVVWKEGALQLVQSYRFNTQNDILYHIAHLASQFIFDAAISQLSISGYIENGNELHQHLQPLFGLISFDTEETQGIFQTITDQPLHYYTAYQKLIL